jgi:hypothetical protein
MVAVPTPQREIDRNREITPNLGSWCRWEFSSGYRRFSKAGRTAASPPAREGVNLEAPTPQEP